MERRTLRSISAVALAMLPWAAVAQSNTPANTFNVAGATGDKPAELGGTATIDLITLNGRGPGIPLRFGGILAGTERVQLGSEVLVKGKDYTMDNAAGVIYLMRPTKVGDTMTVAYRYGAKVDAPAAGMGGGIAGFKFDLVPGGLKMLMGLGMTERAADGRVLNSNIYGLNNSLSFGQGKVAGLFLVGEREKTQNEAGLRMRGDAGGNASSQEEGKSKLILQQFRSALLGGAIEADYQEASKNFAGFGALTDSGVDAGKAGELAKERGMSRTSLGLRDLKFGGLGFSSSFRNIQDSGSAIEWRSYGVAQGDVAKGNGFRFNMSSQSVDRNFNRFKDIREGDREQLMRERGMNRESIAGDIAQKLGKMSFSVNSIEDAATGKGIQRREVSLETGANKFKTGDQEVEQGFGRIGSLLGQEQAMYGREIGLRRQWMALDSSILGKGQPIQFAQSLLRSRQGTFVATDASSKGSAFSLQHVSRNAQSKFGSLGAMNEGEMDANIKAIATMYGPGVQARPEDRGRFLQSAGIDRSYTRVDTKPFAGWNASFEHMKLQGATDGARVNTVNVGSKQGSLSVRSQSTGKAFGEMSRLMEFERQRLTPVSGLDRLDMALNLNVGKNRTLAVAQTNMEMGAEGMTRTTAHLRDQRIEASIGVRKIDAGMSAVNVMADPERDFLAALRGFSQSDARVKWQILSNLKMDGYAFRAENSITGENREIENLILDWSPDKRTSMNFTRLSNESSDPVSKLFSQVVERISVNRNLGRLGALSIARETQEFDGRSTGLPDMDKTFLAYETRIDQRTRVRTEQTLTKFDDGNKENINSNTISTDLSKRAGVSVTDTRIDRKGSERDETRRNYGFWVDLGSGLKVSYGYARHLNGETAGTLTSNLAIGTNAGQMNPDQVAGVQRANVHGITIGGGYGVNEWETGDMTRTQAFSNFAIGTAKPLRFGDLKNIQFDAGVDTAADYARWMRESKTFGFSGELKGNKLNYRYVGMMHPTGYRGIDRTFQFQTDASAKRWLVGSVFYKVRTLPWDDSVMVRNFNLTARPTRNLEVSHQLVTNPEVARGDVFLGSVPQAARSNKWQMNYKVSGDTTFGGSWEELVNEQNNALTRTGGLNLVLAQKSGSPIRLFYGVEQAQGNIARRTMHRYHLQFDQKPGPNQMFSLFAGNVNWEHQITDGQLRNNWTVRVDYQLRF